MLTPSPDEFAKLLSEGIYRIKLNESRPIQVIQDEIGYSIGRQGGSAIEYWRRGNLPAELQDLENLAHALVRRGRLDQEWLGQFLHHGRHPAPDRFLSQRFPDASHDDQETRMLTGDSLPDRNYRRLVGRQAWLDRLGSALKDSDGYWIVAIDGQGGVGKTALAQELTERSMAANLFEAVVWINAGIDELTHLEDAPQENIFSRLLDQIAIQLDQPKVPALPLPEKEQRIQAIFRNQRLLLVIDNMETAGSLQTAIASRLRPYLNPSKALLTSRHRFRGELYSVHLTGLNDAEAMQFIRQDAQEKGIHDIGHHGADELAPLVTVTGGSPLAMKLVVSQLSHFPLPIVSESLRNVQTGSGNQDPYVRFYRHVYGRSWPLMPTDSQRLLVAMAHFAPDIGGDFHAVKQVSDLPLNSLVKSIDALWHYSFLEIGERTSLKQMRYYLHPLTQYFVLSDIVNELNGSVR